MSFVFFDTETTGLKHGFDQIVHFAAIRTDANLNEIGRFEARSRLLPHVLPHPAALRTNGLPIGRLLDGSLPSHYDMVRSIRQRLLSWSPSIFLGYNSVRFDEEMLRHALFQTLHPAYLTSNHNNSRADVWGLVMAAAAVSPACLNVPIGPEGRSIFRLEQLALANGVAQEQAHDALSDAIATLELCRLVHQRSPELWQRFVRFSKKATVADFVEAEDGFMLTEFFANQAYHAPVVCIGRDPDQSNGRFCLNLNRDADRFAAMTDDELRAELAQKPCPVRRLRINAAPTLTAFYDAPEVMLDGLDIDAVEARARRVKSDPALCNRLVSAYTSTREPRSPSRHAEERLYDGFPGPQDEARMIEFHDADWTDRLAIVQSLDDERLRSFGLRLLYFEARSVLPEALRLELDYALSGRLVDAEAGGLTLEQALRAIDEAPSDDASDAAGLLTGYRTYLVGRMERVADFRAKQFAI
ncbi:exonuclease domain-containing protein [Afipia sp. 1NLS2]|uniref:exonuclease domain-containing protein n=1 Tax=Afipia sp. 1NLS2 TaxID=666684 RepID=UPI0002E75517|nr:exonuclease domain-containing protein [Afipia sp. 1NLS2]